MKRIDSKKSGNHSPIPYMGNVILFDEEPQTSQDLLTEIAPMLNSFFRQANQYTPSPFLQERLIYCAVLERAVRDLNENASTHDRESAIEWFKRGFEGAPQNEWSVSFLDCLDILELNSEQQDFLKKRLDGAEKIQKDKLEKERLEDRAGLSSFLETARLSNSQTNGTIQREMRPRGYYRGRTAKLPH